MPSPQRSNSHFPPADISHFRSPSTDSYDDGQLQQAKTVPLCPEKRSADVTIADMTTTSNSGGHQNDSTGYKPVAVDDGIPRVEYPRRKVEISTISADIIMVSLPLAMVIFVAMIWHMNGFQVNQGWYDDLQNTITVLATVFPIVFAVVVGCLMSEAARWKLETGTTVGTLEQLVGSHTVGGAALTMVRFRSFNVLTCLLLILWAFSPLGTQSLLRMTALRLEPDINPAGIAYFDSNSASYLTTWSRSRDDMTSKLQMTATFRSLGSLYTTLVMTSETVKQDTMDLWGHIKIPYMKQTLEEEWEDVPQDASAVDYSSLAGIPIKNIYRGFNITFPLESSYLQLKCSNISNVLEPAGNVINAELVNNETLSRAVTSFKSGSNQSYVYEQPNGTWYGDRPTRNGSILTTWSLALDRFVDPLWMGSNGTGSSKFFETLNDNRSRYLNRPILFQNETGIEAGPTTLLFQAVSSSSKSSADALLRAYCSVTQKYVESRVNCSSTAGSSRQNCSVTAQRPSRKPHAPENISQLSFPPVFNLVSQELPLTVGGSVSYQSEVSLYYLKDPTLKALGWNEEAFLTNITAEEIESRLGQLLNTYLLLGQLYLNITGDAENTILYNNITVPAVSSRLTLVFGVSQGWAALCLASSIVLLGAGILGVVYKHWAQGPEILGYASTVIRDSRYMNLQETGQLDAAEISRNMMKQRIRYGVVQQRDGGEPLVGVGRQEDTLRMMKSVTHK
ncbi:uncharacterized protein CTRU02_206635 [Colletotrichum truncatum]|uniref:Uncharacterized protein n=1 Tax=Colletotrichum truncatum TaxID=5467 RepID=A0ACC3Z7J2_COLTU|nr:uncharacterized protein CTRU02_13757 [Colletotrichum truncatum]KAF6782931.1 hypothetical protein CTRU02_13757 [Colletotrichum truncatum]